MPDDDRLLDALRAADPVDPGRLPAHDDAAPAALLREITMTMTEHPVRPTRRWPVAVAAAAVAIAGIVGVVALTDDDGGGGQVVTTTVPDTDGGGITPGGSSASCVERYDLQTLSNRETAFAGTVKSVEGDQITFDVERWFRGGEGGQATLTSSTPAGVTSDAAITSDGGAAFEPGTRLLVAGDGGFAWGCGFSQPYDDAVAASWADALSG